MKYDYFFKLAKEAGLEEVELCIHQEYSLSFSIFHGEIENYSNNNAFEICARGLLNGKLGAAACDVWDKTKAAYLVKEIVENAKVIENDDPIFIYGGSDKYHKVNTFNKDLAKIPVKDKLNKLFELERLIKAYDEKITEVQSVEYSETSMTNTIINTKGLKLIEKTNYFLFMGAALAKLGSQVKSSFKIALGNDFSKFNVKELADKIGKEAVEQLGGEPCESKSYKAVLGPSVVASLISAYISSANAEEVQKKSSLFIGKLGQRVASRKVTIEDRPLMKTLFARWFDDEGVATYNKPLIKGGILQTYLYNLTTAAKDGVETTGNAVGFGKSSVAPFFLFVKPGKKTREELFKGVSNGVFITEVQGLHAGLNPQSGNFSLQANGFRIENGKLGKALDVVTVSGNLMKLFTSVIEVGNDSEVFVSAKSCPSMVVKSLAVGGK